MTTPDYPDWQQPVALVDQSVYVTGAPIVLRAPGGSPQMDVSSLNSVGMNIQLPNSGLPNRYRLALQWAEQGVNVSRQVITFHGLGAYTSPTISMLALQVPVRGGQLSLGLTGDSADPVAINLFGSTRVLAGGIGILTNDSPGQLLVSSAVLSAPSGGTAQCWVPPAARAITISAGFAITSGTLEVDAVRDSNTGLGIGRLTMIATSSLAGGIAVELPVAGMATELTIKNNDATAHAGQFNVWDVS